MDPSPFLVYTRNAQAYALKLLFVAISTSKQHDADSSVYGPREGGGLHGSGGVTLPSLLIFSLYF